MKKIQAMITALLLLLATNLYAKGGCGGGHGHGGGGVGAHGSGTGDIFDGLRTDVCYGYVVYMGDTQSGLMVCAQNMIRLTPCPLHDSIYRFGSNDTNLAAVSVTENSKAIYMKRHGKKLYRVHPSGRLSLYDNSFPYNTACGGYIVYKGDTLRGMVVCADSNICVRPGPVVPVRMYKSSDNNLTAAALTENNNTIYMKRLKDHRLYQAWHTGRLTLYAGYFSFNTLSTELYDSRVKAVFGGHSYNLNGLSKKKQLTAEVNKAYGLALDPRHYGKKALLQYVSKLD